MGDVDAKELSGNDVFEHEPSSHSNNMITEFQAFISHSSQDAELARWLTEAIENFKLPKSTRKAHGLPQALKPVFLDRLEIAPSEDIGAEIKAALEVSKILIVLCSPGSARSRWVGAEIRHFLRSHGIESVIPVIVTGRFDVPVTDPEFCLPEGLRRFAEITSDESLSFESRSYCDLREGAEDRNTVVRRVIARIAGIKYSTLSKDRTNELRRRQFVIGAAAGAVGVAAYLAFESTRPKVEYYLSFILRRHLPEGLGLLSDSDARKMPTCIRISRQGGLVRSIAYITSDGRPSEGGFSYNAAEVAYRYDTSNALIEAVYRDSHGAPIATLRYSPDLLSASLTKPSSGGFLPGGTWNSPQTQYYQSGPFGDQLMVFTGKTDATRFAYHFDEKGFTVQVDSLSMLDEPLSDEAGIHSKRFSYTSEGQVAVISYHALDGAAAAQPSGIHRECFEYNSQFWMTRQWFEDLRGHKIESKFGFAEQSVTYVPPAGPPKSIQNWFYDKEGKLTTLAAGHAGYTTHINPEGRFASFDYFDAKREPAFCNEGYSSMRIKYDSDRITSESNFFDLAGQLCNNREGHCGYRKRTDERGNVVWTAPLAVVKGLATLVSPITVNTYDGQGRLTQSKFTSAEGTPVLGQHGYCIENRRYDLKGGLQRKEYRGVKGELILIPANPDNLESGSAAVEYEFNALGSLTGMRFFGADNAPVTNALGCTEMRFEFDRHGFQSALSAYGSESKAIINRLGFHTMRWNYSIAERWQEITFFDQDGKPIEVNVSDWPGGHQGYFCFFPQGIQKVRANWLPRGLKFSFYDKLGVNWGDDWNWASVEFFHEAGGALLIKLYGKNGHLRDESPIMRVNFDHAGRISKTVYLDEAAHIKEDSRGVASIEIQYDDSTGEGNQVWRDKNGQQVVIAIFVAGVEPSSMAERMGLRVGDEIVKLGTWHHLDWTKIGNDATANGDAMLRSLIAEVQKGGHELRDIVFLRDGTKRRTKKEPFNKLGAMLQYGVALMSASTKPDPKIDK